MKYLKAVLAIAFAVSLISCSKHKDAAPAENNGDLAGKWKMTDASYTGTAHYSLLGTPQQSNFTGVGKDIDVHVALSESPNVITAQGGYTISVSMSVLGTPQNYDLPVQNFLGSGTWTKSGNTLSVTTTTGATQSATIVDQDKTTLTLSQDSTVSTTYQNAPVELDMHGTYIFTRED